MNLINQCTKYKTALLMKLFLSIQFENILILSTAQPVFIEKRTISNFIVNAWKTHEKEQFKE